MPSNLLLLVLLLSAVPTFGQKQLSFTGCGTGPMMARSEKWRSEQARIEQLAYRAGIGAARPAMGAQEHLQAVRTLPVVVHIVHDGGTENISDAQVQQGIAHLNAAFSDQAGAGVDTKIQFCLAQRDPQGLLTNGITRTQSPLTTIDMETQDLALKDLVRWSPTCYINIWVIRAVNSSSSGNGVVGYAYFPSAHGSAIDGIVMEAAYFGSSPVNSAVVVHEMGHYLGLYHTFEGGCANDDCLADGDRVCDTPPDQTTFSGCTPNANSCNTDADDTSPNNPFKSDVADMGENYMDYSDLPCYSRFTQGQSDRMNWHLTQVRSSLLDCKSCLSPCPAPVAAQIVAPSGPVTVLVGATLNFTATAVNADHSTWSIAGAAPFGAGLNASRTFSAEGDFWIVFRAVSADTLQCQDALDSVRVIVQCAATAGFKASTTQPNAGTPVVFSNQSVNASAYQWLIDGALAGTSANFTHTFTADGVYLVALVASNGLCSDTAFQHIYVGCGEERRRTNFWYFGYGAGLSFAGGSPVAVSNGAMYTQEGVSTISDRDGNLLFYSDGQRIWNRNHQVMPNGTGLAGSPISAQSSIIVPAPGNPDRYYLFTVSNWTDNQTLLSYTLVDMNLNGGLGDVVPGSKNTLVNDRVAEQVTAVYHANCDDIWILTHERNNNRYLAYRLSAAGLAAAPVVSAAGNVYDGANRYGSLRAAHQGKWLCSTAGGASTDGITTTLARFDAASGVVSNVIPLETMATLFNAYSSEFSADDRMLYVVEFNNTVLRQYDLSSANIAASVQTIPTSGQSVNVLQMGPDGKIYTGGNAESFLGVIENPGLPGTACSFVPNAVPLANKLCAIGLPNFFAQYFQPALAIAAPDTLCQQDSALIHLGSNRCQSTYDWSATPGMGTLTVWSDTLASFHSNGTEGPVHLQVVRHTPCAQDTIAADFYVKNCAVCPPADLDAGKDTAVCAGQAVQLHATPGFTDYQWTPPTGLDDPHSPDPVATVAVATKYRVDATRPGNEMVTNGTFSQGNTGFASGYAFGGADVGHYWVTNTPVSINPQWKIPDDHSPSGDGLMLLIDGDVSASFPILWQQTIALPPNTDFTLKFWTAMAYYAEPPNIQIEINGSIVANYTPLSGPANVWIWQPFQLNFNTGASAATIIVLRDLNSAYVGNDFALDDISIQSTCLYSDTVTVVPLNITTRVLDLGPDRLVCANAVRTLDAGEGFLEYRWQNGSTERTFTAYGPGTYWVTVRDSCQAEQSDTVRILEAPLPTLDAGPNKTICAGDSTQLQFTSGAPMATYHWALAQGLSCEFCPSPWARPTQTTTYYLVASTKDGCTNRDSLTVTVQPAAVTTQSLQRCQPFTWNGQPITASGIYRDTLQSGSGCDSIVEIHLTILPAASSQNPRTICPGNSVTVGMHTYTTSGIYRDTLQTAAGCDSVITTQLTVLPAASSQNPHTICPGNSVTVGMHTYTASGIYRDTLQTAAGCDSVVTTQLTVLPAASSLNPRTICPGNSVTVGMHSYTASGIYRDTLQTAAGCDSVITTQLTVLPAASSQNPRTICPGNSVTVGMHTYTASGIYRDTLQTAAGCDSVITTQLTVLPAASSQNPRTICPGNSVTVGMHTYTASGIYRDTLQTAAGCDSVVTTQLTVLPAASSQNPRTICPGNSVTVGMHTYTASGIFRDTLQTAAGCDSVITTQLTVLPTASIQNPRTICPGNSVTVGMHTYTASGIYRDTLQTAAGCDSVVTTQLTVLPAASSQNPRTICPGNSVTVGMHTYTVSGIYRDTLQTAAGCDSVITTQLTVLPAASSQNPRTICPGNSVTVGMHTYTASGIYRDTLQTAAGCDSVITTQLTVLPAASSQNPRTICPGNSVTVGMHTYTVSGIYRDTLQTAAGCDSVITTQLTVQAEIHTAQSYQICEGETLAVGNKLYDTAGQYLDTLSASGGCDSIVATVLAVYPVLNTQQSVLLCSGETLSVGANTYTAPGVYRDTLPSAFGCDSVVVTTLAVADTAVSYQEFIWCAGDTIRVGDTYYVAPGEFIEMLASSLGCDSAVVTRITRGQARYCDSLNCAMYIPNAFSLESGGLNNRFEVFSLVSELRSIAIYDRWGELLYYAEGADPHWDGTFRGKPVNPGVYVYVIKGICRDGQTFTRSGDVTVVR